MTVDKNKVMTFGDTVNLIARTHKAAANPVAVAPHYDGTSGEYDNLAEYFTLRREGKVFGVKIPTYSYSNDPKGIKILDSVGLACTPATNTTAGTDDFAKYNAFKWRYVNGTVDDSGVFHCTAIEGDTMFADDGSNGDVWVMVPMYWYSINVQNGYKVIRYSDMPMDGMSPAPGGKYADGTLRPYLVFSPYLAWCDSSNVPHCYAGKHRTYQFGSHDTGVSYARKKGAGYSGLTVGDLFYIQLMYMLKYATQDSQSVGGCTDYNFQYKLASAETGVKRVCVTEAQAANFVVGSTVNVGTAQDRGQDANHSVAENRIIQRIEKVSDGTWALYLSGDSFDTSTDDYVSTMPWVAGSCRNIQGTDGYPVSGKPVTRQPYRIQGIETFQGTYEVMCDVICNQVKDSDSAGRIELYKFWQPSKYASSVTSDATKCDLELPARDASTDDRWEYTEDWQESTSVPGLLVQKGLGATSSTGTCDGAYSNPIKSPGLRELRRFGNLGAGSSAGAFYGTSHNWLGLYGWGGGGRLSGIGVTAA